MLSHFVAQFKVTFCDIQPAWKAGYLIFEILTLVTIHHIK